MHVQTEVVPYNKAQLNLFFVTYKSIFYFIIMYVNMYNKYYLFYYYLSFCLFMYL